MQNMTVMLRPETVNRLRERAERAGQDVDSFADKLLTNLLDDDPDDLSEEEISEIRAGIQRGLAAAAEGRMRSANEYRADVQERRAVRQAAQGPHG